MMKWWKKRKRTAVAVKTVTARELEQMFLEAPGSRLWQGTLIALDQEVQQSVEDCLDEGLTDQVLRARIGGVASLLRFRAVLEDQEARARRVREEEEESTFGSIPCTPTPTAAAAASC